MKQHKKIRRELNEEGAQTSQRWGSAPHYRPVCVLFQYIKRQVIYGQNKNLFEFQIETSIVYNMMIM